MKTGRYWGFTSQIEVYVATTPLVGLGVAKYGVDHLEFGYIGISFDIRHHHRHHRPRRRLSGRNSPAGYVNAHLIAVCPPISGASKNLGSITTPIASRRIRSDGLEPSSIRLLQSTQAIEVYNLAAQSLSQCLRPAAHHCGDYWLCSALKPAGGDSHRQFQDSFLTRPVHRRCFQQGAGDSAGRRRHSSTPQPAYGVAVALCTLDDDQLS